MNKIFKLLMYGMGVFVVYAVILFVIRKFYKNEMPHDSFLLGLFTQRDLIMGFVIAAVLTFVHYSKNKKSEAR
jgi:hypothetical protein